MYEHIEREQFGFERALVVSRCLSCGHRQNEYLLCGYQSENDSAANELHCIWSVKNVRSVRSGDIVE